MAAAGASVASADVAIPDIDALEGEAVEQGSFSDAVSCRSCA
jgi:hypothetical protein